MQKQMVLRAPSSIQARPQQIEPLDEARRLFRTAARLPYSAKMPNAWARRFRAQLLAARSALAAHILRGDRGSAEQAADLIALHDSTGGEHQSLLRRALDLSTEAEHLENPDIWRMVQLSEETMALAQAVERHYHEVLDRGVEGVLHDAIGKG